MTLTQRERRIVARAVEYVRMADAPDVARHRNGRSCLTQVEAVFLLAALEEAERERDEARAEADRLREALKASENHLCAAAKMPAAAEKVAPGLIQSVTRVAAADAAGGERDA